MTGAECEGRAGTPVRYVIYWSYSACWESGQMANICNVPSRTIFIGDNLDILRE